MNGDESTPTDMPEDDGGTVDLTTQPPVTAALIPGQRRPTAVSAGDDANVAVPTRPAELDPAPMTATPREVVDFIGRGFAWPMRVDASGSIALTSGAADLDSSVRMVLLTAPGERLMRPDFGCRIHELVFEPINPNTLGLIRHAVREALARWEPRVAVEEVDVVAAPRVPGLVDIHVGYRVRATNDRRNLVHPFYLIPQEREAGS
ncbi:GPW/gp25 family protein [Kineosporia sp. J2-2]|uniref:GPW/gp25 family protein n=1 Tax=Kineosporia corallincola TaxID=2835133 RepID=A0ABS5TF21_9ACTN|nr:GPW/gp25 family protein [Kineosporia corallincola]MBT0768204.1 GPW/gp25 family protein [Kineosporia corallincola]